MSHRRRAAFLLVMALGVGACEAGDAALVKDFVQQWAVDHAGEIAIHKLGIPSDDDYVGAAVDGADVIMNLQEADALMAKGRKNSDPAAMDAAIKLRPYDWTYDVSRADLALELGDMKTYWGSTDRAFIHAIGTKTETIQRQQYSELVAVHRRLDRGPGSVAGYASYEQCRALYDLLATVSSNFAQGSPSTEVDSWQQRLTDCDQLPH